MSRRYTRALITGAGSGIGESLYRLIGEQGIEVCALDQHFASEAQLPMVQVQADINDPQLISQLKLQSTNSFDLVIHCAGTNAVGQFEGLDACTMQKVLETNLLAPMRITRDLIKTDLVTPNACHVFVASLSCFVGYPGASAYAGSKEGLWAFARCLNESLRKTGGAVLTVFPGPTDTPHAMQHSSDNSSRHRRMCPDQLAQRIWRAVQAERSVLFGRPREALFAWCAYLLPHASARLMGRWMLPVAPARNDTGPSSTTMSD